MNSSNLTSHAEKQKIPKGAIVLFFFKLEKNPNTEYSRIQRNVQFRFQLWSFPQLCGERNHVSDEDTFLNVALKNCD